MLIRQHRVERARQLDPLGLRNQLEVTGILSARAFKHRLIEGLPTRAGLCVPRLSRRADRHRILAGADGR